MKTMKGQYFSFDAIVASVIFILTFIALVSYWFSVKSSLESKDDEITKEAARISDALLTPAYLANSYGDRRVDKGALLALPSSEGALKSLFNTPYNISLRVTTFSGDEILSRGPDPSMSPMRNIAKVRRVFDLQLNSTHEAPAAMDLYLYN